jgi:hypothetical protein
MSDDLSPRVREGLAIMGAFQTRLSEIEREYPRVSAARIRSILFPRGRTPYTVLSYGERLRQTDRLIALYNEALTLEAALRPTNAPDPILASRLRRLERSRARLVKGLEDAKLGPGHKWHAWPDAVWDMTPAELATTTVKRYARYTHPARWG